MLYLTGISLSALNNYTGAIEYFDKALAIDPKYNAAINNKDNSLSILNLIAEINKRLDSGGIANLTGISEIPTLHLATHMVIDPEIQSYFDMGYKMEAQGRIYLDSNNGSLYGLYMPASSAQNSVKVSDTRIALDITFKIPIHPNSNLERVEKIKGAYDVNYLNEQPDYSSVIAVTNSSMTINSTDYSNLIIEFKEFKNGTGHLYIDGYA